MNVAQHTVLGTNTGRPAGRNGAFAARRARHLPAGHVTAEQLKAEIARGTDYFYARRPHLHRPDGGSFLDFKKRSAA